MKRPMSCLLALLLVLSAGAQEKWDLRRCVDYALANNISVKQQDVQARLARLTYDQAKLSQYPSLNLQSNLGYNFGRSINIATNQFTDVSFFSNNISLQTDVEVFNFFSKRNGIASYRYDSEAYAALTEKVKNDVALNVALAYLQVLLARQQVGILRLKQAQSEAQLSATRKQVDAGVLPEFNALQVEAQVARDSANVVNQKTAEIQALFSLKALLALDAAQPFDVATPPVELIPVEPIGNLQPQLVYESALQNLPQQRYNHLRIQAGRYAVAAARGAMYPRLSFGAGLQTRYSSAQQQADFLGDSSKTIVPIGFVQTTNQAVLREVTQPNFSSPYTPGYFSQFNNNMSRFVGFTVTVPIFNGGQQRTAWKRAQLNLQTSTLAQQADSLTLKQDIYKAHADALNAQEKFNAANKALEMNQRALDLASKRYNIGLLSTLELLLAQTSLTTSQLERASAQFEYVFRMKLLEFYKGQGLKL
ncbi:TolC family protein [Flaviaesturariibacter flavus]|uniref:TolC family protein n=1 Tax=Flaviaesturariibacter flavus TaxID=2502780 RepID=A0A4R1BB91_9BACT|nr:TolC family protein [Flaviaesturariibacter flavus]TCJ14261.1 TolC family protein [Flaviaesturariibacter flavus]